MRLGSLASRSPFSRRPIRSGPSSRRSQRTTDPDDSPSWFARYVKIRDMAVKTASRLTLARRPRRLRRTEAIRSLVRETHLRPDAFVYPLFVCEGQNVRREVPSMPGVFQLSVDEAVNEATAARHDGVLGVLLFGIPASKDAAGTLATDSEGPVQSAARGIKRAVPDLVVITDVCLCEYTSHGHC